MADPARIDGSSRRAPSGSGPIAQATMDEVREKMGLR